MKASNLLTKVKLSDIDASDQTFFIFDSDSDTKSLALSIKQLGLITPVLLRPTEDKHIIISGFNRVKACRLNQMEDINAILVDPQLDTISCLSKAICSVSFRRSLTQPEIIKCICLLSEHLNPAQIAERSQLLFNTRYNEHFISNMTQIGNLPAPCLNLIQTGRLSIKKQQTSFKIFC